jgi:predicted ATPase/DNA-binding SARP family transcriptional activator
MELLWPGMPLDSARTNLRQNLYYLRQSVPPAPGPDDGEAIPFLISDRQSIAVNADYPFEFDVQRFGDSLAGPQDKWPQAVALYRDEFLTDFYLPDSNPFEEWAAARREAFRRQLLNALEGLADAAAAQGLLKDGEGYARQQLAIDPLRETAYRQLMKVLYWSGRRAEALSLYEECVRILENELATTPSKATSTLAAAIREGTMAGQPETGELDKNAELALGFGEKQTASTHEPDLAFLPPEERVSAGKHNLPAYATPIIGRETELSALDGLIADTNVRLVTIVGPGGIGKTRLATAAAEQFLAADLFPDGLYFIDLAPLQETGEILQALGDALDLSLQGGGDPDSGQHLFNYLRQKKMLFLFDNFEHLLDGAKLVADVLQAAPGIKILVTSRERLHLTLEQVFPIEGLAIPDWETPDDAMEYTAARLFLQTALRNEPDFTLRDNHDRTLLARVCRLVAGMPLALELAASWVDILSLDEIAGELQQGLDILETELRDVPERQRSVRACFDYSWRRLDEAEQTVFAQLSIFRGGFTRAAAFEVTGASLRQLSRLASKSLVRFDKQRGRYAIHELLRQYSAGKLARQPELQATTSDEHSNYYLEMMAGLTDNLKGKGKRQALSAIEADLKNVLLAWHHACAQQNIESIGKSLESLWRSKRDLGRQDLDEFEQIVADLRCGEATGERGIVLGRLLAPLGRTYGWRGDTARAREMLEESLELLQRLGATEESLIPLLFLAEVQDSMEESNRLYREGLALARAVDDPWAIGHALVFLVENARRAGDYREAQRLGHEALKQFRKNDDKVAVAVALNELSLLATDLGQYEIALTYARESISVTQEFTPMIRIMGLVPLGLALLALGRYDEAEEQFRQQRTVHREIAREDWDGLFFLGEVAFHKRDFARAAQLYNDSLARAVEREDLYMVVNNQISQGRLYLELGKHIEAKTHLRAALRTALQLDWRPLLLGCFVAIAELLAEEGDSDCAAELATLVAQDPASMAVSKGRAERLLARVEEDLASDALDTVRRCADQSDLGAVAAQLLVDLETSQ